MINPSGLQKPRSAWPKGTLKVNAWHRDENLAPLFRESDLIAAKFPGVSAEKTLPPKAISELAHLAAATDSPYVATAAMDHLYDAYESLQVSIETFEALLAGATAKSQK